MPDLSQVGECLLVAKAQGDDFIANNRYYMVFTGTLQGPNFEPEKYYYIVRFKGLIKLPSGECIVRVHRALETYDYGFSKGIYNFPDLNKFYEDIIDKNAEYYDCDLSDSLKR